MTPTILLSGVIEDDRASPAPGISTSNSFWLLSLFSGSVVTEKGVVAREISRDPSHSNVFKPRSFLLFFPSPAIIVS